MSPTDAQQPKGKRTPINRAALELAIAETVRANDPRCEDLVGVIIERVAPGSPGAANWAIKGVKYGKADRVRCLAVLSDCVNDKQVEFELSD